ncbi:MAG: TlyA family RNA methyltransferase [Spirochaetota bacterium]
MGKKIQLKQLLLEQKICDSLERANSLILSGSVLVNEQKITKSGTLVPQNSVLRILNKIPQRVSRGAYKLEAAITHFKISVKDKVCLDIGASTGGFTEILVEQLAAKVYAFDVGYGQLAQRLRNHPAVSVRDKFHIKKLTRADLFESHDPQELYFVMDLSFISLLAVYPTLIALKQQMPTTEFFILSLIKPQFECDTKDLDKGIVQDGRVHWRVLKKIASYVKQQSNTRLHGFCHSPIKGMHGNREFFIYWSLG